MFDLAAPPGVTCVFAEEPAAAAARDELIAAAVAAARAGRDVRPVGFSNAAHARGLAALLAVGEGRSAVAAAVEPAGGDPVPGALLPLSRGLEWLARTAGVRAFALLPAAWAGREDLDGVNPGAAARVHFDRTRAGVSSADRAARGPAGHSTTGAPVDIVYFLRHSKFADLELRYSLRSVAAHFPDVGKVWVFGDRPAFLAADAGLIEHVPHGATAWAAGFRPPLTNFFQLAYASSIIPDLSHEYLRLSDDMILLGDLPLEQARVLRYLENLDDAKGRGKGRWRDSLWRTYDVLKREGYPGLNFETHVPTYYRRRWGFDAYRDLRDWVTRDRWLGLLGPTAVLNHAVAKSGAEPVRLGGDCEKAGFWNRPPTREAVREKCAGKQFLNFDAAAFGDGMRRFLAERFPNPCRYERKA